MFHKVANLLSIAAVAITVKGEKLGVLTGVMYLAPFNLSGFQVCPKASDGCKAACLFTAGRGIYSKTQNSRINKTRWFFEDRESFMETLVKDVIRLVRKANRMNMIPAIRLNGTSDIAWEKMSCVVDGVKYASIMEAFSEVQFYDYTAILGRTKAVKLPNYQLTFSLKENNDKDAKKAILQGYNVAVVMRLKRKESKPATWAGYPVVNGDETDVRFFDPDHGHIVGLFPKGKGAKDTSGFVREPDASFN
jgi:hypothetical protein